MSTHAMVKSPSALSLSASPAESEKGEMAEDLIPVGSRDWTAAEERWVRIKLDCIVMPLVIAGFFVLQLERGNASNAASDTLFKDDHITQNQFNAGQSALYAGIVLLEIPSNIILSKVGPQIWISFQVLAFGIVATLQNFQHSYGGFMATRIILGCCEAGFIPGALMTIASWYKRDEMTFRNSCLFQGREFASALAGIFAFGILRLAGRNGLAGWRWLFIIEGLLAVFVAAILLCFLPNSPSRPTPLLFRRLQYFTERERYILVARVERDDPAKTRAKVPISRRDVLDVISNPRIYPHLLLSIAANASVTPLGTYGPILIKGLGWTKLTANAMSSVPFWLSAVVWTPLAGWASDRTKIRGPLVIGIIAVYWTFWIAFQQESTSTNRRLRYGLLVMTQSLNAAWHPLNGSWLSLNMVTPQQRGVVFAMFIMSANCGGLVGSQIMRASDAPVYHKGFIVSVSLASFALGAAIFQHIWYRISNKKIAGLTVEERGPMVPETFVQ